MNKRLKLTRKFIYISALIFIVLFSVGYSALSQTLNIGGSTRYNKKYPIRVTGIQLQGVTNSGTEQFNPSYTWNTTTTGVNLPNLNSTVTYTVTVRNYGNEDKGINLAITSNSNSNMTYETSNMPTNNIIPANSTKTFNVTIKYNTSTLPGTTTDTMTITYTFGNIGAMFKTGQEVNAKMKKFVNSSATYSSQDTTITNIARYTGTPNSTYLTDTYKVSVDEYATPIYMWYDSTNTTIYWYSTATDVYYNPDTSYFFSNLTAINSISCMNDISSEYVTNMSSMFYYTGNNSTTFTLDLGDKFDTSNVTDMYCMFSFTGYSSTVFTLDLGDKFDTSKITNMTSMFNCTGFKSDVFTLDLGDNFDTSKVTNMQGMFNYTGYSSPVFTLDLGDKFDTSNVTSMQTMFRSTGYSNTSFTLDLGDNFDTSKVTTMYQMFNYTGFSSTVFTLDLGDKFDTSNVISMNQMFYYTGYSSTVFTLDLGNKFDTSNVTNMSYMFGYIAYNSTNDNPLDLGDKFDTSNVWNMSYMFQYLGYNDSNFTVFDLGDNFDTSSVTNMNYMFRGSRKLVTIYAPTTFVTTAVTSSTAMFTTCSALIGGAGTTYNSSNVTATYAHIDGGTSNPGYFTLRKEATFKTGQEVNARMKQFVSSGATYSTSDTTITNIARFTGTPNSSDLIDANKVSSDDSAYPIYMWYDSANTTIYWYTEANMVYYNPDSSYFYYNLRLINSISCMNDISSKYVTNMSSMFRRTGRNSTVFTLDLGDKFDTSNVTNMYQMFSDTALNCPVFTLNLGNKFDTSNVTNMNEMFYQTGNNSTSFTLDLGDSFDTSNVTDMDQMFRNTGYRNTTFTLDLGDKFDTGNVTTMYSMFYQAGYNSTVFTLNLGNKFDTSSVTNMQQMFLGMGYNNTSLTLDLGDKFDTSSVTNMDSMFKDFNGTAIYAPSTFVTTSVTESGTMFDDCINLVGGAGTTYSDYNPKDKTYAHVDGGTSNPGYFTARGAKKATIYYNSDSTSGSLTVSSIVTSCVPESGSTSCTITMPSVVSSSVGKYNSPYNGLSTSVGNMNSSSLTISGDTTYYANYRKSVTNYYYSSSYTSRTIYRNEYFSSASAMESRLSTSNTGTSNYSTATGPGSSVWTGLSTEADTTAEYNSVQNAANSDSATLYTVYTFNVTYAKGSNVSAIGSNSGSCNVTTSSTSCNVTLPSITANSGYTSVGWSTTNGATAGTSAGSSYALSSNNLTLYANAKSSTVTKTESFVLAGWSDDIANPTWWNGWQEWTVSVPVGQNIYINSLGFSNTDAPIRAQLEVYFNNSSSATYTIDTGQAWSWTSPRIPTSGTITSTTTTKTIRVRGRVAINSGVWTGIRNQAFTIKYTLS